MSGRDCFAAGTLIATPEGPVAVEAIGPGDVVCLARGGEAVVAWHGVREVDCARHPRPQNIMPVRIVAGALAAGVPGRDLVLSPDHAVLCQDVLIPARLLINGRTVRQETVAAMAYHHLELARHDIILAEGAAVESYLDTGNRHQMTGDGVAEFAAGRASVPGCAPWVAGGVLLAAAREVVLAQAGVLGHRLTEASGVRVMMGARAMEARLDGRRLTVRVPPKGGTVRLVSRAAVPAQVFAANGDHRRLGVAIASIVLAGVGIGLDDPRLRQGWHGVEDGGWRWTDGDAELRLGSGGNLTVEVRFSARYWEEAV
jgi:hypothetical protein